MATEQVSLLLFRDEFRAVVLTGLFATFSPNILPDFFSVFVFYSKLKLVARKSSTRASIHFSPLHSFRLRQKTLFALNFTFGIVIFASIRYFIFNPSCGNPSAYERTRSSSSLTNSCFSSLPSSVASLKKILYQSSQH